MFFSFFSPFWIIWSRFWTILKFSMYDPSQNPLYKPSMYKPTRFPARAETLRWIKSAKFKKLILLYLGICKILEAKTSPKCVSRKVFSRTWRFQKKKMKIWQLFRPLHFLGFSFTYIKSVSARAGKRVADPPYFTFFQLLIEQIT